MNTALKVFVSVNETVELGIGWPLMSQADIAYPFDI